MRKNVTQISKKTLLNFLTAFKRIHSSTYSFSSLAVLGDWSPISGWSWVFASRILKEPFQKCSILCSVEMIKQFLKKSRTEIVLNLPITATIAHPPLPILWRNGTLIETSSMSTRTANEQLSTCNDMSHDCRHDLKQLKTRSIDFE